MVDRGIQLQSGYYQSKDYIIGISLFVASLGSMQHLGERFKTGWLGIRIMCPIEQTCLPTDVCFSELAL